MVQHPVVGRRAGRSPASRGAGCGLAVGVERPLRYAGGAGGVDRHRRGCPRSSRRQRPRCAPAPRSSPARPGRVVAGELRAELQMPPCVTQTGASGALLMMAAMRLRACAGSSGMKAPPALARPAARRPGLPSGPARPGRCCPVPRRGPGAGSPASSARRSSSA